MDFTELAGILSAIVWSPFMLIFLVGTGVFLTIRLRFLPLRNLPFALRQVFSRRQRGGAGDISPFQSLMTALAATVGVGNIAGVATAMVLGGPGALIWMEASALFGLSTKYAESVLAVKYRVQSKNGEMAGGPMYALKYGFPIKRMGALLAGAFSVFAVISSLGIGNFTQSNTIAAAFEITFGAAPWLTGLVTAAAAGAVLAGGIKSIGRACGLLVPFMAILYLGGALWVIFQNAQNLPAGVAQIFREAFSFKAAGGGAAGTVIANAIRFGVARGVFSNEAGLGSAPIAAAAAKTDHPSRQGYINMTGTFFDTLVICTLTGLAIASSGLLGTAGPDGNPLSGAALTIAAFESGMGIAGRYVVTVCVALFAFSTLLGWEYYGEKSLEYLCGSGRLNRTYRALYAVIIFFGALIAMEAVWYLSDTMNGLMAFPNLICLLALSGIAARELEDFERRFIRGNSGRTRTGAGPK